MKPYIATVSFCLDRKVDEVLDVLKKQDSPLSRVSELPEKGLYLLQHKELFPCNQLFLGSFDYEEHDENELHKYAREFLGFSPDISELFLDMDLKKDGEIDALRQIRKYFRDEWIGEYAFVEYKKGMMFLAGGLKRGEFDDRFLPNDYPGILPI